MFSSLMNRQALPQTILSHRRVISGMKGGTKARRQFDQSTIMMLMTNCHKRYLRDTT
jgi:hypothetical protein